MVLMKRTNTFKVVWGDPDDVNDLATGCAVLWNKLNYRRRQSFFDEDRDFDWEHKDLYNEFKDWVGSATAQQIIRKNGTSWKSYFALLKKYKNNGDDMDKPSPPGYWKDREKDELKKIIVLRNDCYKIEDDGTIKLPFGRTGRIKGKPHWKGKQGNLEIIYDELDNCWRGFQSVEVEPRHQPSGNKSAYVDLGVIYPVMAYIEGEETTVGYNGRPLLSNWWVYNKQIDNHQSELEEVNGKKSSKRKNKLFRKRKREFRDKIRKMMYDFVERCWKNGIDTIYAGDLTGIRESAKFGKKSNSMVHNFWSHGYMIDRLRCTAENFGIELKLVDERGTSSECPKCGSRNIIKRGRLFKCKECGIEANRDSVGALNIGLAQGCNIPAEVINRAMTRPEVVL